ncbi:MAG: hypothetical protein ABIG39_02120 [Candidatus Micrarchaeota archaeon]
MKKNGLAFKAFPLLLAAVLLSGCAGLTVSSIGGALPSDLPDWLPIAIIATAISFMIISIVYLVGTLLNVQDLVLWAKNEFFQSAAVVIMLSILMVFFSFLDTMLIPGITATSSGGPFDISANNIFDAAQNYLANINAIFIAEFTALLYLNVTLGLFQDATIRVMPMGIGFIIQPGALFTPLFHFVGYGLNFLGIAIWAVQIQYAILEFSKNYMFKLFLPLGIVFRSMPFTRGLGAVLIAIAIAFYVVYPLTFVLNMEIATNHYSSVNHALLITDFNAWVFNFAKGNPFGSGDLNILNYLWYIARLIMVVGVTSLSLPLYLCANLFGDTGIVQEMFYAVITFTMILPIINVFITFTFARGLANILGADVDLSSITRLI